MRPARSGLTIVELLVSLAIIALVMLATAFAIDAGVRAFAANNAEVDAMQRSRFALTRMCAELGSGSGHRPYDSSLLAAFRNGNEITDFTGVEFTNASGVRIVYRFDADDGILYASLDGGDEVVLVRGVESFAVHLVPDISDNSKKAGTGHDRIRNATIRITVRPDADVLAGPPITLAASTRQRSAEW